MSETTRLETVEIKNQLEMLEERLLEQLEQDPQVLIGWGTTVEVACALARREREKLLTADQVTDALALVRQLADSWHEIVPSDAVRRSARGIHGARGLTRQRQRVPDRRSVCGLKGAPASAGMLACCG
jgi:hypothetical protein